MGYPSTSNFIASPYGSAWWAAVEPTPTRRTVVVESVGRAVIAQIQNVLYAGVRPGTRGFNMTLSRRIKVDGIVGPETLNALWAYMRIVGRPQIELDAVQSAITARRFTDVVAITAIWLTYHQPRRIDLDAGPVGARTRVQRTDPAIAFETSAADIRLPAGTVLPAYLEAPGVPEADAQLLRVQPTIVPLDADGNAIRSEQRQVTGDGTDARTQTPATSDTTFTPAPTPPPAPSPAPTTLPPTTAPGGASPGAPSTANTSNTTNNVTKSSGIRPLQVAFGALALAGVYLLATDR